MCDAQKGGKRTIGRADSKKHKNNMVQMHLHERIQNPYFLDKIHIFEKIGCFGHMNRKKKIRES
jgi:hypothetical protein